MNASKHPPVAESSSKTEKQDWILTAIFSLLCISVIFNIFSLYFLTGNSLKFSDQTQVDAFGIKKAILDVEYEKVGGREMYDLVNEASRMQIQEQKSQLEQYIKTKWGSVGTTTTTPEPGATLTQEEMDTLKSDAVIEGSKDAQIMVIEYSEMECPFCAQQYHDTQIQKKLIAQYGDKVNFTYKNNRGVNHPGTEAKSLWLLCAGKLGGNEAYVKFYTYVMDNTTLRPQKRDGTVLAVEKLPEAAKAAGVDVAAWQKCLDSKETLADFSRQTLEAQKFGLWGTPGTLILDTKTGKYQTIEWAYPYETFVAKIDSLLK